jgi:hypothetical protein
MSALDHLRRFENEWASHLRWREKNKYVTRERGALVLQLNDLPGALRDSVLANIELVIGGAVDAHYVDEFERLKKLALDEAERTIQELKR